VRTIGESALGGAYDLVVVDALERPDLAEAAGVWVTPALVREAPAPRLLVVGDLANTPHVLVALRLSGAAQPESTAPARSTAATIVMPPPGVEPAPPARYAAQPD
jgi:hypothetical protein